MKSTLHPNKPILIVDDEPQILDTLSNVLLSAGISNIMTCGDSREAEELVEKASPSLILLDLTMPHISGEVLLEKIHSDYPEIPIIIITGINEVSTAVMCIRKGAADYLVKAIENNKLIAAVRNVLEREDLRNENLVLRKKLLSGESEPPAEFRRLITSDRKMVSLFQYLSAIATSDHSILLRGETGTGKELIAEAVHDISGRVGELVKINAAGLDDAMFSDTLFGHKKGAFSGALEKRPGLIEKASEGTLFLDEIGDLPINSQIKILRLLENGEYYALGSDAVRKSTCRIIAATHQPLDVLLESGQFRKDLYYRLSAYELTIPPLRERIADIPLLADHFINEICGDMGKTLPVVHPSFYTSLCRLEFPGNIRELHSTILHALSMKESNELTGDILSRTEHSPIGKVALPEVRGEEQDSIVFPSLLPTLKECNRMLMEEALKRTKGNITKAAALLGISQPALSKRLSKTELREDYQ